MKFFKYVLLPVLICFLTGCYEVEEEIVVNADGSGTYSTKMDMGQLIAMMQSFAGEDELSKDGMDRPIDTLFQFKDLMDKNSNLTQEQKDLIAGGTMKMQMNIKEQLFKLNTHFAYKNYSNLQTLMTSQGSGGAEGMDNLFKKIFDGNKGEEDTTQIIDKAKDPSIGDISNVFDVVAKDGVLSKRINAEKYKALKARPEIAQLNTLTSSGMEMLYTTTIKLPRPVKKSDNPLLKLSDDKKTVTMRYNMLELLDTPDKFSYTIEY